MKKKASRNTARALSSRRKVAKDKMPNFNCTNGTEFLSSNGFKSTAQFTGAGYSTFKETLNKDLDFSKHDSNYNKPNFEPFSPIKTSSYGLRPKSPQVVCNSNRISPNYYDRPYTQIDYVPWRNSHVATTSLDSELCGVRTITYNDIYSNQFQDTMRMKFTGANFFPVKNSYIPLARNDCTMDYMKNPVTTRRDVLTYVDYSLETSLNNNECRIIPSKTKSYGVRSLLHPNKELILDLL